MNSLFIETSAVTAIGVREAFREVVEKILDTLELWVPYSMLAQMTVPSRTTSVSARRNVNPGRVVVVKRNDFLFQLMFSSLFVSIPLSDVTCLPIYILKHQEMIHLRTHKLR